MLPIEEYIAVGHLNLACKVKEKWGQRKLTLYLLNVAPLHDPANLRECVSAFIVS